MLINTLSSIDHKLDKRLRKFPGLSLPCLYTEIRSLKETKAFGDYQVLAHILSFMRKHIDRKIEEKEIKEALDETDELSHLTEDLNNQLVKSLKKISDYE